MTTESLVRPQPAPAADSPAPVLDGDAPVFADASGRRAVLLRRVAQLLGALVLLWLVAVAAGLAGLGTLPSIPPLGGSHKQQSAARGHDASPASASSGGYRSAADTRARRQAQANLGLHGDRAPADQPSGSSPGGRGRTPSRPLGVRGGGGLRSARGGGAVSGAAARRAPDSRPP